MRDFETEIFVEEEGWVIEDDSMADWAARKVLEEKEEHDRLIALVIAERDRLAEKEAEIKRRYEQKTGFLLSRLEQYMRTVKTRDTATQSSYALLNAKLVYKKPRVDLAPTEGLLDWLEANRPELVKVTKEPMWSEVKKRVSQIGENVYAFADTGEIVDGITAKETPGKFEVK